MPSNTLLYKSVAYKLEDIAPISLVSKAYYAFTVPTALPVGSMQEFIAYAKARPGQLNYGRVGAGSVTELLAKQLEKVAGISMVGVPFRGTGPALQEVAGGRLEFMVGPLALSLPLHEGGQVKILGTDEPRAAPCRAAGADAHRAGRADRQLRLVGHVRRRGHSEAGDRQAQQGGGRGGERARLSLGDGEIRCDCDRFDTGGNGRASSPRPCATSARLINDLGIKQLE